MDYSPLSVTAAGKNVFRQVFKAILESRQAKVKKKMKFVSVGHHRTAVDLEAVGSSESFSLASRFRGSSIFSPDAKRTQTALHP